MSNVSLANDTIDAFSRFHDGDWAGLTFDDLRNRGLIIHDSSFWQFWICVKTFERYTQSSLTGAWYSAKQAKQLEARQQSAKKSKAVDRD